MTHNSRQYSQPTYVCDFSPSSKSTMSDHYTHFKYSNRVISINVFGLIRYATIRSRRLGPGQLGTADLIVPGQLGTGRLGTADVLHISKRLKIVYVTN